MSRRQSLEAFVQPVLVCKQPIDRAQILAQLHKDAFPGANVALHARFENITHAVVIDDKEQPIGCIPLIPLLWGRYSSQEPERRARLPLESVSCLPADTSLKKFWQQLQISYRPEDEAIHWGVTDPFSKQLLGLVDWQRLLPALSHIDLFASEARAGVGISADSDTARC